MFRLLGQHFFLNQLHRQHPACFFPIRRINVPNNRRYTLVLIGGEFGRTPVVEVSGLIKVQNGRDHNNQGFSYVLAGGGVKAGLTFGETDDFSYNIVKDPVEIHDLHATILKCLGVDHTKLTYKFQGRHFRLTDVRGNIIRDILT